MSKYIRAFASSSTMLSPEIAPRTGVLESWILIGLTTAFPGLSNTAIGALTVGLSNTLPLVVGDIACGTRLQTRPKR